MRASPERLAGLVAGGLAAVGAAGWLVAFPPLAAARPWLLVGVQLLVCLLVGVVVQTLVTGLVRRSMAPLRDLVAALARSGERRSDVIAHLRESFTTAPGTRSTPDAEALRRSVLTCMRALEFRQRRYEAWTVGVVHDLKAPLAACANAVGSVVASTGGTASERRHLLHDVEAELRKMSGELQRMVDVVRFSGDDVTITVGRVDLADVLKRLLQQVPPSVTARLTVSGPAVVRGDERLLERALGNLLHNAARNARSSVSVEILPGLVRVADDGGGLPAPLDDLTQPFRSEVTATTGGDVPVGAGGVGLFIARRVLEIHGGRLLVESTSPHGTVMLAYLGSSVHA